MREQTARRTIGMAAMGAAALTAYWKWIRPWHLHWGATPAEFSGYLPGDDLVPFPKHRDTHAITIHAPVADVWPWLVQMGQDRGGFYSYDWLENLVGCQIQNADQVVPEWQSLHVGDTVRLHPKAPPLPVAIVEPQHAIVLQAPSGTWGFYLKKLDENTTRLLVRSRWDWKPDLLHWAGHHVLLEPTHFVMERKTILGIKQRAEAQARCRRTFEGQVHPQASLPGAEPP
jgi:hypothetical protein